MRGFGGYWRGRDNGRDSAPPKKYQIPPAARMSATTAAMSGASIDRRFGSDSFGAVAGFATVGAPT